MGVTTAEQARLRAGGRLGAVLVAVGAAGLLISHPVYAAMVTLSVWCGGAVRFGLRDRPIALSAGSMVMAVCLFSITGFALVVPSVVIVAGLPVGAMGVGLAAATIIRLVPIGALLLVALDTGGETGVEAGWVSVRPIPLALLAVGCLLLASVVDRLTPVTAVSGRLPDRRQLVSGATLLGAAFALAALLVAILPELPSDGGTGTGAAPSVHPGFYGDLDVSGPIELDEELEVLRIESDAATYWRGTTYDVFDGRVWEKSRLDSPRTPPSTGTRTIEQRITNRAFPTWVIPTAAIPVDVRGGGPNLEATWRLDLDETVRADVPFLQGDTVTVVSEVPVVDEAVLRASDPRSSTWRAPSITVTDAVAGLARTTVAGQPTVYDEILALQAMIGDRVEYTRDIEQLPPGVDAVEHLLFDSGRGFCEQIGTSLVAMATALDIPARLVVGFVPGDRDRLRGEWIVRAGDAHAWVEVYFPGVGWQGFDPTASVPLSADAQVESPWGAVLAVVAVIAAIAASVWAAAALFRRVRRPERTWAAAATERLIGVAEARGEEVDDRLTVIDIAMRSGLAEVGRTISEDHFGSGADPHERAAVDAALADAEAHAPRRRRRRRRRQLT